MAGNEEFHGFATPLPSTSHIFSASSGKGTMSPSSSFRTLEGSLGAGTEAEPGTGLNHAFPFRQMGLIWCALFRSCKR